ncbi:MAG: sodium:solute symporter family protein [Verrucomicrobia bacterium]|nr:sodium:solute symporter family protein [Verrucomicrobiota bacterium]
MHALGEISIGELAAVLIYLFITAYLGWLGYQGTKNSTDYMVAGRKAHPTVVALSYAATFISTSAIVGFGGAAGMFGMSLLWLCFANILIGIFVAFVWLGRPTRRMGAALDAHTFPELLGRRFQSRFLQAFAGLIIVLFMPLYGTAVLIGGTEFFSQALGLEYGAALFIFAALVAAYVFFGGLKGVMYTDAFQGALMCLAMIVLLLFTYKLAGGVVEGHRALGELKALVPASLQAIGHRGWTAMPEFGFGSPKYNLWWIIVGSLTLGVGVGVLAQPQMAVRFLTVRSGRELDRAVGLGGVFVLLLVGTSYVTGALSNLYFIRHGPVFEGRVVKTLDAARGQALIQVMEKDPERGWADMARVSRPGAKPATEPVFPAAAAGKGPLPKEKLPDGTVREGLVIPAALIKDSPPTKLENGVQVVQGRTISLFAAKGLSDRIIPLYITTALPKWFGMLFMLSLLAAAMSTLSSQFHTVGAALGRDVVGPGRGGFLLVRLGVLVAFLAAAGIGYYARTSPMAVSVVARATAIFFGLCASAFLPTFVGGLFWRRMTRAGAISSTLVGFLVTALWLLLVKTPECRVLGLVSDSLLAGHPNWPVVDPLLVALPLSALTAVLVSLAGKPMDPAHLARCFGEETANP